MKSVLTSSTAMATFVDAKPQLTEESRLAKVLLAEDDVALRSLLAGTLRKAGYDVMECPDGLELMEYLTSFLGGDRVIDVDLVISDIRMPWITGLEVLQGIHEYIGYPPMILITAFGDDETHARAKELGAAAVLDKPFDVDELLILAETYVKAHQEKNRTGGAFDGAQETETDNSR